MKITFKPNKLGIIVILGVLITPIIIIAYRKRKKLKQFTMDTINYIKEKTWDIVTDSRINSLHPLIREKANEFIIRAEKELGIKLRVTSALRTWAEQEALYNRISDHIDNDNDGQIDEADEQVTHAKAGQSYHNYGLAFDVVEIKDGKALWSNPNWEKIGQFGEKLGFTWGGRWVGKKNDKPHFQMTFGKNYMELAELYKSGNRNGEYVNLT